MLPIEVGHVWYVFEPSTYGDDQAPLLIHEQVKPSGLAPQAAAQPAHVVAEGWQAILAKSLPLPSRA